MAKLFNNIRKQLVSEKPSVSRTSNYLKYAVGEIVLVVIGILIALQINNWNEQRKLKKVELNLLYELNDVLEGGTFDGRLNLGGELTFQKLQLDRNKKSLASCEYILKHFEANLPYNDSLKYYFANAHTRYIALVRDQAYQNAKNYGLSFIKNDTLRAELMRTYETNTDWLLELNRRNNLYENNTVIPLLTRLFENVRMVDYNEDEFMIPIDYEALKNNMEYRTILKTTISKRKEYIQYEERRYRRMLKIHELLKKEIASRTD